MKIDIKRLTFLILEALLFIAVSLLFVTFVSSLGNFIGSVTDVTVLMAPYWLSVVIAIYFLFVCHLVLFPENEKKLLLTYKVNGIILAPCPSWTPSSSSSGSRRVNTMGSSLAT